MPDKTWWCVPESCPFCYLREEANYPTCEIRAKKFGGGRAASDTVYKGRCNVTAFDRYTVIESRIQKAQKTVDYWQRFKKILPGIQAEDRYIDTWIAKPEGYGYMLVASIPEDLLSDCTLEEKEKETLIQDLKNMYAGGVYYTRLVYKGQRVLFEIMRLPIARSLLDAASPKPSNEAGQ